MKSATYLSKQTTNLFKTGLQFEQQVIKQIERKHKIEKINYPCIKNTMKAMESNVPIIYNAYVENQKIKCRGICDLLIRVSYLNILFPTMSIPTYNRDIYVPVEIKNILLPLVTNGLIHSKDYFIYKSKIQILVYLLCLNHMQKYENYSAYIIGNGWYYIDKKSISGIEDPLNLAGKIDFKDYDKILFDREKNRILG